MIFSKINICKNSQKPNPSSIFFASDSKRFLGTDAVLRNSERGHISLAHPVWLDWHTHTEQYVLTSVGLVCQKRMGLEGIEIGADPGN